MNSPQTYVESERLNLESDVEASISHELRTPLTSIQGALGLLLTGKLPLDTPQAQQLLSIATKNTSRLLRLTHAIEQDKETSVSLISAQTLAQFRLEADLYNAWHNQTLQLYYQPIIALESDPSTHFIHQRLVGVEGLLRWFHPDLGCISPTEFIPLAEKTGLIHELGVWGIETACRQLAQWQQVSQTPLFLSMNLSPSQLLRPELSQQVIQICDKTGIAPSHLQMEITESLLLENSQVVMKTLEQLKQLGIGIYLDDFGTGYSSLARLNDLAVDVLKIDRSFVAQTQWRMIEGILQLAKSLGLKTIIEGIETKAELQQVQSIGGSWVQGYYYSRPLPHEAMTLYCRDFSQTHKAITRYCRDFSQCISQ
ncbi:EAL domain-containing protein [Spirulina sp. CS-785/01]|uniref:putative bifunctional diguanylate cyclase/phosphodiesterase n=1 Tax=Spirulina sp. CS-785/01 TaxID=3021716 RepID=UPI00232AA632|nr:EAL domain-containing protein [Spirulina sp. CS-785/01]MDB9315735.1 EAL domain-containing protein [Spirulina sp. CS-785/01]